MLHREVFVTIRCLDWQPRLASQLAPLFGFNHEWDDYASIGGFWSSHNFLKKEIVGELGVGVQSCGASIKAVNTKAKDASNVHIQIGKW